MLIRKMLCGILIFAAAVCSGEELYPDSIRHLPPIEIHASRISRFFPGIHVEHLDTTMLQSRPLSSFSALLSQNTSTLIRSYGTGGLATISFRGSLTTQSGVFWNGFNLNQPNIGMTDLSMIPVLFFNSVDIHQGGASSAFGNGLIGGGLHLSNQAVYSQPAKTRYIMGIGSFGELSAGCKLSASSSRLSWTASLVNTHDPNRFSYKNENGKREMLNHALCTGDGFMNQLDFQVTPRQTLSLGNWIQLAEMDIPATLVMADNDQHQTDKAIRNTFQYTLNTNHQKLQFRTAYFSEYLYFLSRKALIDAEYLLNSSLSEMEYQRQLNPDNQVSIGGSLNYSRADISYYEGIRQRSNKAVFASWLRYFPGINWKMALSIRKEFSEGYHVPLCPSFSAEGLLGADWTGRLAFSGNYRIPTLNDRYWQPGGNPDLMPESSWNQEAGLIWKLNPESSKYSIHLGATAYNMLIDNLIQWVPSGPGVSSPMNVARVWSRGLETEGDASFSFRKMIVDVKVRYTYSPSTSVPGREENPRQLIYIPLHRCILTTAIAYRTFRFSVSGSSQSKRYVVQDNTNHLEAFTLFNLTAGNHFRIGNKSLAVNLEVKNLLDTTYQVVQNYPEPGISLMTQIQFIF